MKTYRVVLTRVYVVGQAYDVRAATPTQAEDRAVQAAQDKRPDPRAEAIDGGWRAEGTIGIREIGAAMGGFATLPMRLVGEDVFERGE